MSSQAASSSTCCYSATGFQGPSSDLTAKEKETCRWNQRNSLSTKQTEEHPSLGTHNCLPRLGGGDQLHLDWNTDRKAKEFGGECGLFLSGALMFHTFKKIWIFIFSLYKCKLKDTIMWHQDSDIIHVTWSHESWQHCHIFTKIKETTLTETCHIFTATWLFSFSFSLIHTNTHNLLSHVNKSQALFNSSGCPYK